MLKQTATNNKSLSICTFFCFPNCCWVYHIINNLLCMLSKNCSFLHIFIQMHEFNTCCEEPWAGFHSYTDKPDLASFYKADGCPIRICKTESACSRKAGRDCLQMPRTGWECCRSQSSALSSILFLWVMLGSRRHEAKQMTTIWGHRIALLEFVTSGYNLECGGFCY